MALIRIDHKPESLKLNVPLYLIVPDPGKIGSQPLADRPVLYLLHGLGEDGSAWFRHTEIEALAEEMGLVVVMPSCGRSFYRDIPNGIKTFTYLTEELPAWLADIFDIRPVRSQTFIAGSSMGGYGSFQAAFHRPDLYGAAASFSGVLSLSIIRFFPDDPRQIEFEQLFGDLSRLPGGPMDPMVWLGQAARDARDVRTTKDVKDRDREKGNDIKAVLPRLMVSCGKQDELYPLSVQFRDTCLAAGIPLEYYEEDGEHNWYFWNRQLRRFLSFALGSLCEGQSIGGRHD